MANIVFVSQHGTSFLLPAFALARKLQRRGHAITFCVQPDCEEMVQRHGFAYAPIWASIYPKGWLKRKDEIESKPIEGDGLPYDLDYLREVIADLARCVEVMREGELEKALGGTQPDLFITDIDKPELGLAAHRTGVPVMSFASVMTSPRDGRVPPLSLPMMPQETPEFLEENRKAWDAMVEEKLQNYAEWFDYPKALRKLAAWAGYPEERIDFDVEMAPRLPLHPQLLFFPKAFDLPRAQPIENGHHVEAMLDLGRPEADFDYGWLDASKPLIYCAVGMWDVITNLKGLRPFFQGLLEAVAQRPQYQAVVCIGPKLQPEEFSVPPNAKLAAALPQIGLLRRAALSINHAGIGTVKETLYHGVPMLAAWSGRDNPGYAVRVAYHGLGLERPMAEVDGKAMGAAIDELLGNPAYARNARRMSEIFVRLEEESPAVQLVERELERKRR